MSNGAKLGGCTAVPSELHHMTTQRRQQGCGKAPNGVKWRQARTVYRTPSELHHMAAKKVFKRVKKETEHPAWLKLGSEH